MQVKFPKNAETFSGIQILYDTDETIAIWHKLKTSFDDILAQKYIKLKMNLILDHTTKFEANYAVIHFKSNSIYLFRDQYDAQQFADDNKTTAIHLVRFLLDRRDSLAE